MYSGIKNSIKFRTGITQPEVVAKRGAEKAVANAAPNAATTATTQGNAVLAANFTALPVDAPTKPALAIPPPIMHASTNTSVPEKIISNIGNPPSVRKVPVPWSESKIWKVQNKTTNTNETAIHSISSLSLSNTDLNANADVNANANNINEAACRSAKIR
jgi:hypothetical protein